MMTTIDHTPSDVDHVIRRGATLTWPITLYEDAAQTVPHDLTGYALEGKVRLAADAARVWATFDVTIDDPAAGEATVTLGRDVTATLDPDVYVYDLELYDLEDRWTVASGTLTVEADVTR